MGRYENFQAKMKEKIQKYSQDSYLDGYMKNEFLTDDGDADIFLNVPYKRDLFDSKTVGDQIDLSWDVYDFIEEKTSMLDNDIQINLHITGCFLSPHEQGIVKHVLKEHYAIELYKIQKEYHQLMKRFYRLMALGIITLVIYTLLFFLAKSEFLDAILGFIVTFAIWKAVELYLDPIRETKNRREAITQNLLINVEFDGGNEKDV